MSAASSNTLGGFYQSDSPRITEDPNSPLPDTPRSMPDTSGDARFRRESDPGSIQEGAIDRTNSRNSIIGLGIQFTSKFQVSADWGGAKGKILTFLVVYREADRHS